jgi:hypothetical protein
VTGRLVYADVPHRAPPFERATRPLCWIGNATVFGLVAAAARTARVAWEPSPEVPAASRTRGPIVYLTWHRFNFASTPALALLPEATRPSLVMHDGLASRALTHDASRWFGFETFVFRRRSPVSPRAQIAEYVRATGRSVVVLPDSGGPYGRVKPGMMQVAAECGAWMQPFVVRARGAAVVGRAVRHVVPLPRAELVVRWGEPLPPGATAEQCQRCLDALGEEAGAS